jgi:hypothetical protein
MNMQNIQHIFDIEVKYDIQHLYVLSTLTVKSHIEHPCVSDIEVKPDIEHAANLAPIATSTFKICWKTYHMLNIGGVERFVYYTQKHLFLDTLRMCLSPVGAILTERRS